MIDVTDIQLAVPDQHFLYRIKQSKKNERLMSEPLLSINETNEVIHDVASKNLVLEFVLALSFLGI